MGTYFTNFSDRKCNFSTIVCGLLLRLKARYYIINKV